MSARQSRAFILFKFRSDGKQGYKTQEKIPDFLRNRGFAGPSDEICPAAQPPARTRRRKQSTGLFSSETPCGVSPSCRDLVMNKQKRRPQMWSSFFCVCTWTQHIAWLDSSYDNSNAPILLFYVTRLFLLLIFCGAC